MTYFQEHSGPAAGATGARGNWRQQKGRGQKRREGGGDQPDPHAHKNQANKNANAGRARLNQRAQSNAASDDAAGSRTIHVGGQPLGPGAGRHPLVAMANAIFPKTTMTPMTPRDTERGRDKDTRIHGIQEASQPAEGRERQRGSSPSSSSSSSSGFNLHLSESCLEAMRLMDLHKLATAQADITEREIDDVMESDTPKAMMVMLLLAKG